MNMRLCCFMVAAALPCACLGAHEQRAAVKGGGEMGLSLTSSAFEEGGMIPRKHTCDGADVSPPLAWSPVPAGAKSIALICDDPDAPMGTWVHWVVFNLPGDASGVPEGISPRENLEKRRRAGRE